MASSLKINLFEMFGSECRSESIGFPSPRLANLKVANAALMKTCGDGPLLAATILDRPGVVLLKRQPRKLRRLHLKRVLPLACRWIVVRLGQRYAREAREDSRLSISTISTTFERSEQRYYYYDQCRGNRAHTTEGKQRAQIVNKPGWENSMSLSGRLPYSRISIFENVVKS